MAGVAIALISGEVFARYYLGLGTPPLSVSHPTIEYLFAPNQDVYRFGNHIVVNAYGMRSEPFTAKKSGHELRVMVFGDSVMNGGNLTDQKELATELVRGQLRRQGYANAVVGNISAGSWGPGNWLAYAREYGFFDADVVVLVLSSHDYADNPLFTPLNPSTHPTERPVSALLEGIQRYLPRYLPRAATAASAAEADTFPVPDEQAIQRALQDLSAFLQLAHQQTPNVLVLQHFEKSEIQKGAAGPGYQQIKETAAAAGIDTVSLEPYLRRSLEAGVNPYRDNIHPNAAGQKLIAEALLAGLAEKLPAP